MKECKYLLQNLFKNKFDAFKTVDKILKSVFDTYYIYIQFLKIDKNVLYLGVKIPHLLGHFIDLKKTILQQINNDGCNIVDIVFTYKNNTQSKKIIKKKLTNETTIQKEISFVEKNKIYQIIQSKCTKEDYKELLYQLYLKTIKK